jgi:hypothetical protein
MVKVLKIQSLKIDNFEYPVILIITESALNLDQQLSCEQLTNFLNQKVH